jgi:thiamine kinase-like enzyme
VIRFLTSTGCFYLKQTPADLFIEPAVIQAIQKNIQDSPTPTMLSKNHELNCFLMKSCGDHSLRTKFNGTIDTELLIKGLHSYINILRSFEQNQSTLQAIGVPDWRLNRLPQLYIELLEKKDVLQDEGLTDDELDKLMRLVPTIKSICEFLMMQKVKETLVNGDFNENNLIMNEETQQLSIIDWGESVISHPFFSIASHLRATARRYELELNGQLLENIKQNCLSCWSDVANINELEIIYQNILRLLPVFSSLGIYRLQVATNNTSKKMQRWFIAGSLRTLLKNESTK